MYKKMGCLLVLLMVQGADATVRDFLRIKFAKVQQRWEDFKNKRAQQAPSPEHIQEKFEEIVSEQAERYEKQDVQAHKELKEILVKELQEKEEDLKLQQQQQEEALKKEQEEQVKAQEHVFKEMAGWDTKKKIVCAGIALAGASAAVGGCVWLLKQRFP